MYFVYLIKVKEQISEGDIRNINIDISSNLTHGCKEVTHVFVAVVCKINISALLKPQ